MRTKITLAALVAFAGLAFAQDTCKQVAGKQIGGLAVYAPDVTHGVKMGQSFEIKWQPTAGYSTVSLLLLKGPSTNVVPHGCIANSIPNSGSYTWSVPTTLDAQPSGYGIQIIADGSGDFQYSSQFGVGASSSGGPAVITSTTLMSGSAITTTIYHTSYKPSTTSCSTSASVSSHKIVHTHNSTSVRLTPFSSSVSAPLSTVTESVSPTGSSGVPTDLPPVTNVVVASESPSVTKSASTTTASKASAASRVVGCGAVVAGLGAVAALLL